jgi:uncharacterized protein YndB with AHSA1/START domain
MSMSGKKKTSITLVREIRSSASDIYAAWTDPSLAVRWLASEADTASTIAMDVRMGGLFRLTGKQHDGQPYTFFGTYLDLIQDRRIVLSWAYQGPDSALNGGPSTLTIGIRPLTSENTELTLTHEKLLMQPIRPANAFYPSSGIALPCFVERPDDRARLSNARERDGTLD